MERLKNTNPFGELDNEIEYIDPYVFPEIAENETETEQTSSFSMWQTSAEEIYFQEILPIQIKPSKKVENVTKTKNG